MEQVQPAAFGRWLKQVGGQGMLGLTSSLYESKL